MLVICKVVAKFSIGLEKIHKSYAPFCFLCSQKAAHGQLNQSGYSILDATAG